MRISTASVLKRQEWWRVKPPTTKLLWHRQAFLCHINHFCVWFSFDNALEVFLWIFQIVKNPFHEQKTHIKSFLALLVMFYKMSKGSFNSTRQKHPFSLNFLNFFLSSRRNEGSLKIFFAAYLQHKVEMRKEESRT